MKPTALPGESEPWPWRSSSVCSSWPAAARSTHKHGTSASTTNPEDIGDASPYCAKIRATVVAAGKQLWHVSLAVPSSTLVSMKAAIDTFVDTIVPVLAQAPEMAIKCWPRASPKW